MQVKEISKTNTQAKYEITVSVLELNIIKQTETQKVAEQATIQGFRQGKAPLNMVELQYRSKILGEVLEVAVNDAVEKLYKEQNLNPLGSPKIDVKEYKDNSNLVFEAEISLFPKINDVNFSNITINKVKIKLSDSELQKALDSVANNYKSHEDITEDRATILGDVAVINFIGSVDGVEFAGGKGNDYPLELGSNSFIPGFEDQLVGKKVADKVDVKVKFPASYQAKDLAGKDALFVVDILKIQKAVKSEINDDLAKKVGMQTLDELKASITEQHTKQTDMIEGDKVKKQLIDELDKVLDFEVPASIVLEQEEALWKDYLHKKEHMKMHEEKGDHKAHGHTDAELEYFKKSESEVKAEHKAEAVKMVKISLFFNHIGTSNKLKLEQADLFKVLNSQAQMYGMDVNTLFNQYKENEQFLKQLHNTAIEEKIVNFILSQVKINEKEMSFDDYIKEISVK
jgi:trigger factor